ncbi:hypothetical protein NUZ5A_50044 [Candidatus Nitrosotenuis uzonensis]|uniref:Uncharacterized protein n=1 Tax=Candidatus Nitrosotenuis uzonensis TaxID=1407055 RepID=A0A812EZE1_9ARCH|nr:hypothetical protein NUZ5A_50044 [Candidatus Nitrosotenuis uzonensis]
MIFVIWIAVIAGMYIINAAADSLSVSSPDAKGAIEGVRSAGTEGLLNLAPDQVTVFNIMLPAMGVGLSYGVAKA